MQYKLIVSDIDGVWTNGSFYYTKEGDSLRKFTTRDSYGVSLCRLAGLPLLIISTESNDMVRERMNKLGIDQVELGVRNKLKVIRSYCEKLQLKLSEVAYLGDDMNDYHLLGEVGLFACPQDAYHVIKEKAGLVLRSAGGEGAFREFVETLLEREGKLQETYEKYIKACLEK